MDMCATRCWQGGAGTIAIALVAYYYILLISVLLHSSIALSTSECCILLPDKGMTKPGGGSIRHLDWEFLQSNGTLPPASSFLTKDDRISDCKKSHFIHIINPRRLAERQHAVCLLAGQVLRPQAKDIKSNLQNTQVTTSSLESTVCELRFPFHPSQNFSSTSQRMNKSSSTAAPKFPQKSAWAKGPPSNTSTAPSTRPQSPATQSPAQTHSRRSSQLGNVKDAANLGFAKNNAPPKNGA